MRAGFWRGVEIEKACELRADAGDVLVDLLAREQLALLRSCRSGSPIMPVPPPTIAIGEWPKRCSRASPITVSSDPTCRLDAVGSKPM